MRNFAISTALALSIITGCAKGDSYTLQNNSDQSNAAFTGSTSLNITDIIPPIAAAVPGSGKYSQSATISLTINEPGIIYYTINGTVPTQNSTVYTSPVTVYTSTVVKYIAFDTAGNKSPAYQDDYIIVDVKNAIKVGSVMPSIIRRDVQPLNDGNHNNHSQHLDSAVINYASSYDAAYVVRLTASTVTDPDVACATGQVVSEYDPINGSSPSRYICSGSTIDLGVKGANTAFTADGNYRIWICSDVFVDRIQECAGGSYPSGGSAAKFPVKSVTSGAVTFDNVAPAIYFSPIPDVGLHPTSVDLPGAKYYFDTAQFVTLSTDGSTDTILYTVGNGLCGADDGSDPINTSAKFADAFYVSQTSCIRTWAYDAAGNETRAQWSYVISGVGPTVVLKDSTQTTIINGNLENPAVSFTNPTDINIAASGSLGGNYDIYYTLDESDPADPANVARIACLNALSCPITLTKYVRIRATAKDISQNIYSSAPLDETFVIANRSGWSVKNGEGTLSVIDKSTSVGLVFSKAQLKNLDPTYSKGYGALSDDPMTATGATPTVRRKQGLLMFHTNMNPLLDSALVKIYEGTGSGGGGDSNCGITKAPDSGSVHDYGSSYLAWPAQNARRMQSLARMCPDNADVTGTSIETLINIVGPILNGLSGAPGINSTADIFKDLLEVSNTRQALLPLSVLKKTLLTNLVNPHQYSSVSVAAASGGSITCPSGCTDSVPLYLSDFLEDLQTFNRFQSPRRQTDGTYAGGSVMESVPVQAIIGDDFRLTVDAAINFISRTGLDLSDGNTKSKTPVKGTDVSPDFSSLNLLGVPDHPLADMNMVLEEAPGYSDTPSPLTNWSLDRIVYDSAVTEYVHGSGNVKAYAIDWDICGGFTLPTPPFTDGSAGALFSVYFQRDRASGNVQSDGKLGVAIPFTLGNDDCNSGSVPGLGSLADFLIQKLLVQVVDNQMHHGGVSDASVYITGNTSADGSTLTKTGIDGADIVYQLKQVDLGLTSSTIVTLLQGQLVTPGATAAVKDLAGTIVGQQGNAVDLHIRKNGSFYYLCYDGYKNNGVSPQGFYSNFDGSLGSPLSSEALDWLPNAADNSGTSVIQHDACIQIDTRLNTKYYMRTVMGYYRIDILTAGQANSVRIKWFRLL